jgi:hypothetical protein
MQEIHRERDGGARRSGTARGRLSRTVKRMTVASEPRGRTAFVSGFVDDVVV